MERSLLQRVEVFLRETAMPPTVFGRSAARDPRLVSDLRGGRQPGMAMVNRVEHFMNKWREERQAGLVKQRGDRRLRTQDHVTASGRS